MAFYPGKNKLLFEGQFFGTTRTGDATKTTYGNTLTSWVLNDYVNHKTNLLTGLRPKSKVGGDDVQNIV